MPKNIFQGGDPIFVLPRILNVFIHKIIIWVIINFIVLDRQWVVKITLANVYDIKLKFY